MTRNRMRPIHPGEILREEFLVPLGMSLGTGGVVYLTDGGAGSLRVVRP